MLEGNAAGARHMERGTALRIMPMTLASGRATSRLGPKKGDCRDILILFV